MLSSKGWLTDPEQWITELFFLSFKTQYSQSNRYLGHVSSLQYLTARYYTQPEELEVAVQEMYSNLYNRFYDRSEIHFTVNDSDASQLVFDLSILAYKDGVEYSLQKRLSAMQAAGEKTIIEDL